MMYNVEMVYAPWNRLENYEVHSRGLVGSTPQPKLVSFKSKQISIISNRYHTTQFFQCNTTACTRKEGVMKWSFGTEFPLIACNTVATAKSKSAARGQWAPKWQTWVIKRFEQLWLNRNSIFDPSTPPLRKGHNGEKRGKGQRRK